MSGKLFDVIEVILLTSSIVLIIFSPILLDTSIVIDFEPLTFEHVMNVINFEKPDGVLIQFGGQTPLNIATQLKANNVNIIGTDSSSIDLAEDRKKIWPDTQ